MAALALWAGAAPWANATDLAQTLTTEEVQCDAQQLERLAARMVVSEVDPQTPGFARNPTLLLWRHPFGGASFGALGVTDSVSGGSQGAVVAGVRDERQLSAELVLGEEGDILDPRHLLLPHATLARRNQDSNLAANASEFSLKISLDAATAVPDPTQPGIPLIINNFSAAHNGDQPRPLAEGLGRGFLVDGLAQLCHSKLTAFDERISRILSRTLRISRWFTLLGPGGPVAWNVTLFRGESPHLYRGTIYCYQVTCFNDGTCPFQRTEPAALELIINWDAEGRLTDGQIRLVPRNNSGELAVFLLPPMRPGRDRQVAELTNAPFLRSDYPDAPDNTLTAHVNWGALLANSRWNE